MISLLILGQNLQPKSLNTSLSDREDFRSGIDSNLAFKFSEINEDEVICQLRNLKISKSTGI